MLLVPAIPVLVQFVPAVRRGQAREGLSSSQDASEAPSLSVRPKRRKGMVNITIRPWVVTTSESIIYSRHFFRRSAAERARRMSEHGGIYMFGKAPGKKGDQQTNLWGRWGVYREGHGG